MHVIARDIKSLLPEERQRIRHLRSKPLLNQHIPIVPPLAQILRWDFRLPIWFSREFRGALSLPGRPYDGHTLSGALDQVTRLSGQRSERCYVDLGYRGHDVEDMVVFKARQQRGVTKSIRRELKRRNAIEPIIGHMKYPRSYPRKLTSQIWSSTSRMPMVWPANTELGYRCRSPVGSVC